MRFAQMDTRKRDWRRSRLLSLMSKTRFAPSAPLAFLLSVVMLAGMTSNAAAVQSQSDATSSGCENPATAPLQVPSPDWREQVVYMLFIDRFNDGNPDNNDQGYGEYNPSLESHFSGGDIQGLRDQLDYLKDLGVTAVWVTPPVLNQWWSTPYEATGWHGYWAVDFKKVDPHFGTLDDYRWLSRELHCRGMYLIQDIVANHTANYFTYDNQYNPEDTAENFRLLEPESHQRTPSQFPFNMIDRLNPEHAAANIYHWTPSVIDYNDPHQEKNYSLGHLADLNTENPVVIEALKDSYKFWIEEAGVDAFRIDTVMLVPHKFWRRFLHDDDGIYAFAKSKGKDSFLTFGEAVRVSQPFERSGEERVASYIGTKEDTIVNSMLGYPLYFELIRVFAQGLPPAALEYRLKAMMEVYPDPFAIPNFIDNHDTPRFLASGSVAAMKQALAFVFTIPGLPIVYQGTEQGFDKTRYAMFKGGRGNATGSFDQGSVPYRWISELSAIRKHETVLTHGEVSVVAAAEDNAGLLVTKRTHKGETIYVIFNTANHAIFVDDVTLAPGDSQRLEVLMASHNDTRFISHNGDLRGVIPERGVYLLKVAEGKADAENLSDMASDLSPSGVGSPNHSVIEPSRELSMQVGIDLETPVSESFEVNGVVSPADEIVQLIYDGNLSLPQAVDVDDTGRWSASVPIENLGRQTRSIQAYAPNLQLMTAPRVFETTVEVPKLAGGVTDATGDAVGPTGNYIIPQHAVSEQQRDIQGVTFEQSGDILELSFTMASLTDIWVPFNGFDNVALSIFFSDGSQQGVGFLPELDADLPEGQTWQVAHVGSGWASYTYRAAAATPHRKGERIGYSPTISVDKSVRRITIRYDKTKMGITDWSGIKVYVSTWDMNGEGEYVHIQPSAADWFFGGAPEGSPKILDDAELIIAQ